MRTFLTLALLAVVGVVAADEREDALRKLGLNPEEVKRKLLEKFDLNGDGNIDDGEKAKVAEQMQREFAGGKIPDDFKAMLDRNGDGVVDAKEMAVAKDAAARLQGRGDGAGPQFGAGGFEGSPGGGFGGGQIPPEVLKKFDKNKDGELDEKEQKAAMAAYGPKKSRSEQLKEKLDLNGDGKITKEEKAAVAAQRKAEQEERKANFKKK